MSVAKETKKIQRVIIFGIIPLVVYAFALHKLFSVIEEKEKNIDAGIRTIQNYYKNGFSVPSQESVDAQLAKLTTVGETVNMMIEQSVRPIIRVPENVEEQGVYFKERL